MVLSGLRDGEPIVVGNTFFLDAERRLQAQHDSNRRERRDDCPRGGVVHPSSLDRHCRGARSGASAGELARRSLSRDAIPDLSDPQIVLVADWMGHPATEVASDVTRC